MTLKDQSFEDMLAVIERSNLPYKWERKLIREFVKYREEHYKNTQSQMKKMAEVMASL